MPFLAEAGKKDATDGLYCLSQAGLGKRDAGDFFLFPSQEGTESCFDTAFLSKKNKGKKSPTLLSQ